MKEEWRGVLGYEGLYQVSNMGNIRSLNYGRTKQVKLLTKTKNAQGYYMFTLHRNGVRKYCTVHQAVATAFLGHKSCGMKLIIDHKDFDRTNNNVDNLEIVTPRQNTSHKKAKHSSKYTGVFLTKHKTWVASIWHGKDKKHLGTYSNEIDAHNAYQNELTKIKQTLKGEE